MTEEIIPTEETVELAEPENNVSSGSKMRRAFDFCGRKSLDAVRYLKKPVAAGIMATAVTFNVSFAGAACFFAGRDVINKPAAGSSRARQFGRQAVINFRDIWAGTIDGALDLVSGRDSNPPAQSENSPASSEAPHLDKK